jgi:hypothetical protein
MPEKLKKPEEVIRNEGKIPKLDKLDREKELPIPSNYSSKIIDHLRAGGIITSEKDRADCWNELNRIWKKTRREKLPPSEIFDLLEAFAKKAAEEEGHPMERSIGYPKEIGRYGDELIEIRKGVIKEYLPTNYALKLAIESFRKAGLIKTREDETPYREKLFTLQQKTKKELEPVFKDLRYSDSLYDLEKDGEEVIRINGRHLVFFSEILGYLAKGGAIKSPDDVIKCGNEIINLNLNADSMLLTGLVGSVGKAGLIKSTEDLRKWVDEIGNLGKLKSKMDEHPIDSGIFTAILLVPDSLVDDGFIKSTEDLKKYGNEMVRLSNYEYELSPLLQTFNQLIMTGIIKKPVLFPRDDEEHYRNELLRLHLAMKESNIHERDFFKVLRSLIRSDDIKSTQDIVDYETVVKNLLKDISITDYQSVFSINNALLTGCESLIEKGLIKSREDLRNYGSELVKLAESMKKAGAESYINALFESGLGPLAEPGWGALKSLEGLRELTNLTESAGKAGIDPYGLLISSIPKLARSGLIKSPEDIAAYGGELVRLSESAKKAGIEASYLPSSEVTDLAQAGVVKSLEEIANCGNALVKLNESAKKVGFVSMELEQFFHYTQIITLAEEGVIKSPTDAISVIADLSNNIRHFSSMELDQFKPENFSPVLRDLGAKRIAELAEFPLEKVTPQQKEWVSRMISSLHFIKKDNEVRTLIKHGFENTFQQFYDSLEENKRELEEMKNLGISTEIYVYHHGVEKVVFKKTLTGIEKLEAGKEHIEDRFYDVINQLFNNPKGDVFKRPGKVLSDAMQLQQFDSRDYATGDEKAGILLAMMKSDDELWLKGALSVLETNLKTVGQPGSVVVDSEEMKQEARTALFHVQEIERLLGMPIKPMKGEVGEITISIKLSDKNPLIALTTGSDSGCCVAFNGGNNWTLPVYMKDMATQIAEIFVTKEGRENRIGQAWLFAGKIGEEPALIVDSVNITSSYKNMSDVYEATIDFIKDLAEKAGFKKIVMGTSYNDAYPYAEKKFGKDEVELEKIHTFGRFYSDALDSTAENTATVFVIK